MTTNTVTTVLDLRDELEPALSGRFVAHLANRYGQPDDADAVFASLEDGSITLDDTDEIAAAAALHVPVGTFRVGPKAVRSYLYFMRAGAASVKRDLESGVI